MRALKTAHPPACKRRALLLRVLLGVAATLIALAPKAGMADEAGPHQAPLRTRAARWVAENPVHRPTVVIDAAARTASYAFDLLPPVEAAEAFGLDPEDPLVPLYRAQVALEAVRSFVMEPVAKEPEPADRRDLRLRWSKVLEQGESHIATGLEEIRSAKQPAGALQDRAAVLGASIEVDLFDALLDWADAQGLALDQGAPDAEPRASALPSADSLRELGVKEAGFRPAVGPTVHPIEGGIEYSLGAVPEALEPAGDPVLRPLIDAEVRLELLRNMATSADGAQPGPSVVFWQPVVAEGHGLVKRALDSLSARMPRHHAASVLARSAQLWGARVRDLVFDRLWEHANRQGLALWALTPSPENVERPAPPPPTPGVTELRIAVEPDRWVAAPRPAEYQTLEETVLVTPAHKERLWIAPEMAVSASGETVVVRPGRWEEVEVAAVYETRTRQVCVTPAHRDFEFKPARYISIQINEAFGSVRHVWFLDRWSYDRQTKYRPDPSTVWDQPPASPQHPPWMDLTTSADALVRRRQPVIEGYVIVVGTKGASGPSLVRFGETVEGTPVFTACDRLLTPPPPPDTPPQPIK